DFTDYLQYIQLQLTFPSIGAKRHETWKSHLKRLRQHSNSRRPNSDYRVLACGINAADYGAPQKRHRAIVLGLASEYGDEWQFPTPTHSQDPLAWPKHVATVYWDPHGARRICEPASVSEAQALHRVREHKEAPAELPWVTVRDVLANLPQPTKTVSIF